MTVSVVVPATDPEQGTGSVAVEPPALGDGRGGRVVDGIVVRGNGSTDAAASRARPAGVRRVRRETPVPGHGPAASDGPRSPPSGRCRALHGRRPEVRGRAGTQAARSRRGPSRSGHRPTRTGPAGAGSPDVAAAGRRPGGRPADPPAAGGVGDRPGSLPGRSRQRAAAHRHEDRGYGRTVGMRVRAVRHGLGGSFGHPWTPCDAGSAGLRWEAPRGGRGRCRCGGSAGDRAASPAGGADGATGAFPGPAGHASSHP